MSSPFIVGLAVNIPQFYIITRSREVLTPQIIKHTGKQINRLAQKHSPPSKLGRYSRTSAENKERAMKSVTAFQRALVPAVSLKQLFSSHSVPTSHSQLLAACTHMYIRPRSHFIRRGNRHPPFCLTVSRCKCFLSPCLTGIQFAASQTTHECALQQARNNALCGFWLALVSFA